MLFDWVGFERRQLTAKISKLFGIPVGNLESIQVMRYTVGQQFKVHNDGLDRTDTLMI